MIEGLVSPAKRPLSDRLSAGWRFENVDHRSADPRDTDLESFLNRKIGLRVEAEPFLCFKEFDIAAQVFLRKRAVSKEQTDPYMGLYLLPPSFAAAGELAAEMVQSRSLWGRQGLFIRRYDAQSERL